ncbi:hypothetical protein ISN45_At01g034710 [Arabidopsis thaliana x Arabidopsis arenosa]|uniref:Uncharacterized protein n=1 Tax=Arabidopsis thaliana x Arabidopsis arenosa TaxID=1240361 RepID=A0A8T2GMP4_9BRAS|nr:hypothetical protein ISN45_At01g034710 [Arabidopsis thaliana x Arabidopsis arenosa]
MISMLLLPQTVIVEPITNVKLFSQTKRFWTVLKSDTAPLVTNMLGCKLLELVNKGEELLDVVGQISSCRTSQSKDQTNPPKITFNIILTCILERKYNKNIPSNDVSYQQVKKSQPLLVSSGSETKEQVINMPSHQYKPYVRNYNFKAHMDVEWCCSTETRKYLFKYIKKMVDKATIVVERASGPAVQHLSLHLPDQQPLIFDANQSLDSVISRDGVDRTMFTEWMKINQSDEEAKSMTYVQFPTRFVWNTTTKKWTKRKQGFKKFEALDI